MAQVEDIRRGAGQRVVAGVMLVVAVAGLHGLLWSRLGSSELAAKPVIRARPPQTVRVAARQGPVVAGATVAAAAASGSGGAMPGAVPGPGSVRVMAAGPAPAVERLRGAPQAEAVHASGGKPSQPAVREPVAPGASIAPPLYPVRLPGPARLQFVAWRGEQKWGETTLDWRPDGARYQLSLRLRGDASGASAGANADAAVDAGSDATGDVPVHLEQTSTGRARFIAAQRAGAERALR